VKYEHTEMVLHTDNSFMPIKKSEWSPVNFRTEETTDSNYKPVATVWMNAIQDELIGEKNLFQTWAPDREPAEDSVIFRWTFDRAILNNEAVEGILELDKYQGRNNVFFVGAYSKYGIPLLENGVCIFFELKMIMCRSNRP